MKYKNSEFNRNNIVISKKNKTIKIDVSNIEHIVYYRPCFWGFISAYVSWSTPGILEIYLKEKIDGKKAFLTKIKYDDVLKLPSEIKVKIGPKLIP
jgi:hypothetical protein